MSDAGYGDGKAQAERIIRELETNPEYDPPGWLDIRDIEAIIDPQKPYAVNLSRVADELL